MPDETLARPFHEMDVEPLRVARVGVAGEHALEIRNELRPLLLSQARFPLRRQDVVSLPPELAGRNRGPVHRHDLVAHSINSRAIIQLDSEAERASKVGEGVQPLLARIRRRGAIAADRQPGELRLTFRLWPDLWPKVPHEVRIVGLQLRGREGVRPATPHLQRGLVDRCQWWTIDNLAVGIGGAETGTEVRPPRALGARIGSDLSGQKIGSPGFGVPARGRVAQRLHQIG